MANEVEQHNGAGEETKPEEVDEETLRARAYEISQRDDAGSPAENWERASAELRAERDQAAKS